MEDFSLKDPWRAWLQSRDAGQLFGKALQAVKTDPATFNTPNDLANFVNSLNFMDLFKNQDKKAMPFNTDYSTTAINVTKGEKGIPDRSKQYIAFASEPSTKYGFISPEDLNYNDIPKWAHKFIPQAIYEHEVAHGEQDKLTDEYGNRGYLKRRGLEGGIYEREKPAMRAEDNFWDFILGRGNQ